MVLQDKFQAALDLIQEHNKALDDPKSPGHIDAERLISAIKEAGGTSEDRLKRFSYEDILDCFPKGCTARFIAKDLAKIFRGKDEVADIVDQVFCEKPSHVSAKKADKMTVAELINNFDPEDFDNSVGKRLKTISKGKAFIVFSQGRTVDRATTLMLLEELKKNYDPRPNIKVGKEIKSIYAIGELPDAYVDENPLYPGRPLRPDGTCDQLNRSWCGVDISVRQLLRLALVTKELSVTSEGGLDRAHQVLDIAMDSTTAFDKFSDRYRRAACDFKELERLGKLPLLLVKLNLNSKGGEPSGRPFDGRGEVVKKKKTPRSRTVVQPVYVPVPMPTKKALEDAFQKEFQKGIFRVPPRPNDFSQYCHSPQSTFGISSQSAGGGAINEMNGEVWANAVRWLNSKDFKQGE